MGHKPDRDKLVLLVGLAASMAGCSSNDDGQWRVCADAQGRRMPDIACEQNGSAGHVGGFGGGGGGWVFINRSSPAPAVGNFVLNSSRTGSGTGYSAPAEGISRGGFGSTAEAGGAGHGAGE